MNYKESITALLEGLKGIFENKTATEASAIAQAATKPSTIFYTSDTHAIVVGGQVYGRSNQVSADAPFAYLPADVSSPAADPQFDGNHDTIYIQPIKTGADAGKIKLWWYVNNAWVSSDTLDLVLPTEAEDITYDLTNTPDLGSGDVQSAIEALDGKVEEAKEDVVRTGYLIASWEDDKIQTSTTYAVGSTIGEWGNGVRYGCRGVRLNVKEGDKVLLDTYSPALFGLIFTDENRVVKALYDDRRFDGVWTAPCDGYCYIQDVLYRENYHYASAHGHLAYMAHDARKRVAKGGDWYNELAPKKLKAVLPFTSETTPAVGGPIYFVVLNGISNTTGNAFLTYYNALNTGKMQYKLVAVHAVIHENGTTAKGSLPDVYYDSTTTTLRVHSGEVVGTFTDGDKSAWTVVIKHATSYAQAGFGLYFSCQTGGSLKMTIDKVFVHTSSDFAELYKLAQKITNGEVEVDNFYGVKEKEVDFVKNAIGLQSISDLGYNILEHGATLPIDEEGYKYAKEIYDRYKDTPISSWEQLFKNDDKLVYLPMLHFSNAVTSNLNQQFSGCHNLICVPPMNIPATSANSKLMYSLFDACYSLKRFEFDMDDYQPKVLTATWRNCHSLEYIGELPDSVTKYSTQWISGCESLERIERLPLLNILAISDFAYTFLLPNLRYVKMVDFGRFGAESSFNCSYYWANWGIPNDKHPDARQSLVDSLLTYSYDRVNDPDELGTAGTTCTITLSANSYAQLTASEIEEITAKGYTLTHP